MQPSSDDSDANPLSIWHQNVKADVHTLRQLILLRTRRTDFKMRDSITPQLNAMNKPLQQIEQLVADLHRYIDREIQQVDAMTQLSHRLKVQRKRVEAIKRHAPDELITSIGLDHHSANASDNADNINNNIAATPRPVLKELSAHSQQTNRSTTVKPTNNTSSKPPAKSNTTKKQQKQQQKQKPSKKSQPVEEHNSENELVICSVSDDELRTAPQYVRGRLTVAKIDASVDKLNGVLSKKVKLLTTPPRNLSSTDLTTRGNMLEANCAETEGKTYITDADIKWAGVRMDATMKCAINVLRHFSRLKEVRGKNKMRIFIVNEMMY